MNDELREAAQRLCEAIEGERADWHRVEVRPYDLTLAIAALYQVIDIAASPTDDLRAAVRQMRYHPGVARQVG